MSQKSNTVYKTFVAGADLSGARHCFVKLGSNPNEVVLATDANSPIIGIVSDFYRGTQGTPVTVAIAGTEKVVASDEITAGQWLTATTGGKADATTTAGANIRAVALESSTAANQLIEVLLTGPCTLAAV